MNRDDKQLARELLLTAQKRFSGYTLHGAIDHVFLMAGPHWQREKDLATEAVEDAERR
jgi:hypothetical protein